MPPKRPHTEPPLQSSKSQFSRDLPKPPKKEPVCEPVNKTAKIPKR